MLGQITHPITPFEIIPAVQVETIFFPPTIRLIGPPISERQVLLLLRHPDPLTFFRFIAPGSPVEVLWQSYSNYK